MRPTTSILGASRLPLTPKRANKDFYKGTRQSFVPGGGHRTGPPGKHVVQGKAKYRLVDERVRYFVGPGQAALESTELKPYVSIQTLRPNPPSLPSFSPNLSLDRKPSTKDFTKFSKRYQRLGPEEKQSLIMETRRNWWEALSREYPAGDEGRAEEARTAEVENRAEAA